MSNAAPETLADDAEEVEDADFWKKSSVTQVKRLVLSVLSVLHIQTRTLSHTQHTKTHVDTQQIIAITNYCHYKLIIAIN